MQRRCAWCGRTFEAKTRRALYCGPTCRKAHNRAERGGMRLGIDQAPPEPVSARITEKDISRAVVVAKGALAVFDSGRDRAPRELRPLCARLADGLSDLLGGVGL